MEVKKTQVVDQASKEELEKLPELTKEAGKALQKIKDTNLESLDQVVTITFRYGSTVLRAGELFTLEQLLKKMQKLYRGEQAPQIASIHEIEKVTTFIKQQFPNEAESEETFAEMVIRLLGSVPGQPIGKESHLSKVN